MRFFCALLLVPLLGACGSAGSDGPVQVAIIGEPSDLSEQGLRLSPAAQHLRAATTEGLVSLDSVGQVVPAIAERWIVTEDGQSYIFRLRNSDWPDGRPITAEEVRRSLRQAVNRLSGTSLGLDLVKIADIRAMTGRVIEIRLTSPMPDFLRLLAQPELGITHRGEGAGPMALEIDRQAELARLQPLPPERLGLPAQEDWEGSLRPLVVRALPAGKAAQAFSSGEVDIVLNGQIASFPLADTGPLSRGNLRLDPARGLFGLMVRSNRGLLGDPLRREALAMAIDRAALLQPLNIGGWQSSTWIVPAGLFGANDNRGERWQNLSLEQRRAIARQRVAGWPGSQGGRPRISIAMAAGPGNDVLFRQIARDLDQIGVVAVRARQGERGDLELYDRLARYDSPLWYLNQFNCLFRNGICSPEADDMIAQALVETDPGRKEQLLEAAHRELTASNVFIALGAPVRWSLVRGDIRGFDANEWGVHPLFPLSQPPN